VSEPDLETVAVPWSAGRWTHPPVDVREEGPDLLVTAAEGSDAWQHTAYGFVHDSEHGLLAPLAPGRAVEVEFTAGYDAQFDQAGLLLRASPVRWIKAGVELADGVAQVGAVVTDGRSDWSVAPVPEWAGHRVTVRASRAGDAVTIRARAGDEPFRLVRLAPWPPDVALDAGPYCCAPTRAGLTVRFHAWRTAAADGSLH